MKRFIKWAGEEFNLPILEDFLNATPTAELEPITKDYVQADEVDMGMTYDERELAKGRHVGRNGVTTADANKSVSIFGVLRKEAKLGTSGRLLMAAGYGERD